MQVTESFLRHVYVREDGLISAGTPYGPWSPGIKQLMNYKGTLKGHKPAYYYRYFTGDGRGYLVHRMVAVAFCENPNVAAFNVVAHINHSSLDNRKSNLRWVNQKLNRIANSARNTYWDRRWNKWTARVAGKSLGYYSDEREAWLVAQSYKAELFTKTYRAYIINETETTRACENICGRVPTPNGPPLPGSGNRGSGVQLAEAQHFHNKLPTTLQAGVLFPQGESGRGEECYSHPVKVLGPTINGTIQVDEARNENVPSKPESRAGFSNATC